MTKVFFTRHAPNRMRRLGWIDTDVFDVLRSPLAITPSISGRENAWAHGPSGRDSGIE